MVAGHHLFSFVSIHVTLPIEFFSAAGIYKKKPMTIRLRGEYGQVYRVIGLMWVGRGLAH